MLENVLNHLHNWFCVPGGLHFGDYTIENGCLELPFLKDGQYYRIVGSVFNDGLHKYGDISDILDDEEFTGTIWALAIPKAVLELAEKIEEWQTKNAEAVESPYSSESFGGYSYSIATDSKTGDRATWETVFRSQLKPWRKLREFAPVQPRGGRYGPV